MSDSQPVYTHYGMPQRGFGEVLNQRSKPFCFYAPEIQAGVAGLQECLTLLLLFQGGEAFKNSRFGTSIHFLS